MKIVELAGRLFVRGGIVRIWVEQIVPHRRVDGLGYIRIWVTPPRRLVFWNGAASPSLSMILSKFLFTSSEIWSRLLSLVMMSSKASWTSIEVGMD